MNKRIKKKQKKMINKKLCKRYPFLIPRNRFTGKIPKNYDYSYTEHDALDHGWKVGFGRLLLEDLRLACESTNYLHELRIMQWKEKYGKMELYINAAPQEVHDVISKYRYISQYICIECGSPNAQIVNDYGWYLPLCENCWNNGNKKREKSAIKYGHNFTPIPWCEVSKENVEIPFHMEHTQYSKENGKETISVNISDISKKILDNYNRRKSKKSKTK